MAGFVYFDTGRTAQSTYNGTSYYDAAKAMTLTLQKLDSSTPTISFDISKLDTARAQLEAARQTII